jgi:hypothetical protein
LGAEPRTKVMIDPSSEISTSVRSLPIVVEKVGQSHGLEVGAAAVYTLRMPRS